MTFPTPQLPARCRPKRRLAVPALLLLCLVRTPAAAQNGLPAFPGAEGFGALATGGRGGEVYHVTNLNDSGSGSLRDAVSKGPRIVVFDVGGYIPLKSILSVRSNITLAGQTAPGEGIGTRNYEVSFSGSKNVIVRYMRFRQGLTSGQDKKSAINITSGSSMIFDHCSVSWGRWDTIDMNRCSDITFQHCLIAEGIAPQRFGCLCQSDNITFSHCLWINHHSRNPKSKGRVQFLNNVVYNWQLDAYIEGASAGVNYHDIVGNYFIKGPSTGNHGPFAGGNANARVYADGNWYDDNRNGLLDGRPTTTQDLGPVTLLDAPFAAPPIPVTVDTARDAYFKVVAGAGASLRRDAVDARIVLDLTSLGVRGRIISDPAEVGGFGELQGGMAAPSCAGDGIPDSWKLYYGLDPCIYAATGDFDATGYTNVEKYINGTLDGSYAYDWTHSDIGDTGLPGNFGLLGDIFTVQGSGTDIGGTADAFQFVYQQIDGDGGILAHVSGLQNTDSFARAGVMIRESLDPGSPHALLALTPGHGAAFQRRLLTGGSTRSTEDGSTQAPYWVFLQRVGDLFTAYKSGDGGAWEVLDIEVIPMGRSVYVGLAVCSRDSTRRNTATFDNVAILPQ